MIFGQSRPRLRALALGFVSCLFFIASFSPIGLWACVFLAPVPLFMLARTPIIRPHRAGFYGAIGMMPAWWWTHQWIAEISIAGLLPLVIYLSIYTMLFVWIGARVLQRWGNPIVVLPVVLVAIEFARGAVIWTGYPWYFVGHPMIDAFDGLLAAPASIAGVYLISFFVALIAALITEFMVNNEAPRWRTATQAVLVLVIWASLGWFTLDDPMANSGAQTLRVGVVQPNVPQDNRMDWTTRQRVADWLDLRALTYQVARMDPTPEVIIWPEGFVPGWTLDPVSLQTERDAGVAWMMDMKSPDDVPELDAPSAIGATLVVDEMLIMQRALSIPMVVGSVAYDDLKIREPDGSLNYRYEHMYNSAFVLVDGQPQPIWYDKLHLTPFGEIMPYISAWPWLENKLLNFGAQGMAFVLTAGDDPRVLSIPTDDAPVQLATPICFEATLPQVCRRLVFRNGQRQAAIMVNMTNDGWFGTWTAGRKSHELMARWRCVELATPMVRCANTGISGAIDSRGQIIEIDFKPADDTKAYSADQKAGGFVVSIELPEGSTAYSRVGDSFGWILLGLMLLGAFIVKKPRSASQDCPNAETDGTIKESNRTTDRTTEQ